MSDQPLVTAITIFLNGERFLEEAIESVRAQTLDDWELLLVDDGSTDGSAVIARRYADAHPGKIVYLQHPDRANHGMSAARNVGIRAARGKYIALLDADDVWLPQKFERQVAIMEARPDVGMLYGPTEYWRSWTGRDADKDRDTIPDLGIPPLTVCEPPSLVTRVYPLGQAAAPCLCSLLVRTDVARQLGGFEEPFTGFYEDQAFLAKVYLHQRVLVTGECWDRYRAHDDSCSAEVRKGADYDAYRLQFLTWLKGYLEARQIQDAAVWDCLNAALMMYPQIRSAGESIRGWRRLLRVGDGSAARLAVLDGERDAVRIAISKIGTGADYDIQLNHPKLMVVEGHRYRLSLRVRADSDRTVGVGCAMAHAPWTNLGFYERWPLTSAWQHIEREFVLTAGDENARIHFDVGDEPVSVEIADMRLRDLSADADVWPQLPGARGDSQAAFALIEPTVPFGEVQFGSLRRLTPISEDFGCDRGRPIDRYYVEHFIERQSADIRGRVLEIGDRTYTRRYGGSRVTVSDMLHVTEGEPEATIIADLTSADHIPSDTFDCIILTQTLQLIYDVRAAIATLYRILKPGGVLLTTFPGISQTGDSEWESTWCWSFTRVSAQRLFTEAFPASGLTIETHGNVLAAISFLHGLSVEELTARELDYREPGYTVTIAVRAVKPLSAAGDGPDLDARAASTPGQIETPRARASDVHGAKAIILMYHRVAPPGGDANALCVAPERFGDQLAVLRQRFDPTPLRDLVDGTARRRGDRPPVVVTFDDGYADNLHHAKPALERYEIPATVFVTSGYIGLMREFWWDELEKIVVDTTTLPSALRLSIGGVAHQWQGEPRRALYEKLWQLLQPLDEGERRTVLGRLRDWAGTAADVRTTCRPLSVEELVELARGGLIEIGSHTVTHALLTECTLEEQAHELTRSASTLERLVGTRPRAFAYPYGAFSLDSVAAVRAAGFTSACATVPGVVGADSDCFQLPRFGVGNWTADEFDRRLTEWLT